MELMKFTIEIDDMTLMSCMSINKEAIEKYKDDFSLESLEKLTERAEPVCKAIDELASEIATKHMYICKSKGKKIETIELHMEEINNILMLLLSKKMNE